MDTYTTTGNAVGIVRTKNVGEKAYKPLRYPAVVKHQDTVCNLRQFNAKFQCPLEKFRVSFIKTLAKGRR